MANPSRTQDLYFVADGTGGHVFAETLDQHNRNVQRWRLMEKDAKDKAGAGGDVDKSAPPSAPGPAGAAPAPAAAPHSDQHGELDQEGSIYGALPTSLEPAAAPAAGMAPSMARAYGSALPSLASAVPWPTDAKPAHPGKAPGDKAAAARPPASALALGPGLADLGISLRGVVGPAVIDGPVSNSEAADASRRGGRAARFGGRGAGGAAAARKPSRAQRRSPTPLRLARAGPFMLAVVDVSEGTPLDPLLDKTYDLNSAKTVPSAKDMALPN